MSNRLCEILFSITFIIQLSLIHCSSHQFLSASFKSTSTSLTCQIQNVKSSIWEQQSAASLVANIALHCYLTLHFYQVSQISATVMPWWWTWFLPCSWSTPIKLNDGDRLFVMFYQQNTTECSYVLMQMKGMDSMDGIHASSNMASSYVMGSSVSLISCGSSLAHVIAAIYITTSWWVWSQNRQTIKTIPCNEKTFPDELCLNLFQ